MQYRHALLLTAWLGLLVVANLVLDVAALWFLDEIWKNRGWLDQVPIGIILGQLMLVALWLGLGDGRWYIRLLAAVAITIALGKSIGIAGALTSNARDYDPDPSMIVAFIFLAMMLASSWIGFVIRRLWNWRLTWEPGASLSAPRQFQIGDALLWMVIIGGSLGAIRFLMTINDDFLGQLREIIFYAAMTTSVTLAVMIYSFSHKKTWRSATLLVAIVLLLGIAVAIPDVYDNYQRMRAIATVRVPITRYAVAWFDETKRHEVCALAVAGAVIANCHSLRALGCRLQRPDQQTANAWN